MTFNKKFQKLNFSKMDVMDSMDKADSRMLWGGRIGKSSLMMLIRENLFVRLFIIGYFSCVIVGWMVLQLPFCQTSFVTVIDTFFTASSAVSTTGLASVDIGKAFSFVGQLIIVLLIQLGGIGYLMFSSYIILSLKKKMMDFPEKNPIAELIKQVVVYTIICEVSGSIILYFFFNNEGAENSLWNAIFHSISAFCTAGFSLFSSNMEGYKNHFGINITLSLLSLLGAFGFFLYMDLFKTATGRKTYIFTTRIIRSFATSAILIGSFLFLLTSTFTTESSEFHKLNISFFHIVSTITTAGFNTIDIKTLPHMTHFFLIILMLCGVSLVGCGINMKGTSFAVLISLMKDRLTRKKTSIWNQKIFLKRAQIVLSTFAQYLLVLLLSYSLIALIEEQPFLPLFFETASALCTVGLSMGITPELSTFGKSFIILLMLVGRTGILILGFAISHQELSLEPQKLQVF
jgi:trk system potassium uptake protein